MFTRSTFRQSTENPKHTQRPAKWSGSTTWHDAHAPTRNRGRGGAARRRVFVSLIPSHSPSRRGRRDPLAGRRALTLSASLRTPCHAQAARRGVHHSTPTIPSSAMLGADQTIAIAAKRLPSVDLGTWPGLCSGEASLRGRVTCPWSLLRPRVPLEVGGPECR